MKTQILILLAITCLSSFGSASSSTQILCGRRLANTLAYMCYDESVEKRSGSNRLEDKYWWTGALGSRGKRGGVVEECCEKPCSIDELLSYC
ncbi:bombyxin B-10-like [Ostrinia furnacalis]|uniref:bombyxin B-10-like n=1 Tax=Ostrinia furnacalis TaxID=93504 RepID=UPI00104081BC|nr:bombyxin B-10-like [Ostrinia furnacalis]